MLFHSFVFLYLFLPLTLLGWHLLRGRRNFAIGMLITASLLYYGWWNPLYLPLIIGSCAVNFAVSRGIHRLQGLRYGKILLAIGICVNLLALGWFKYAHFISSNISLWSGADLTLPKVALPLAISFFTFQQIAYLIDTWQGKCDEHHVADYMLFVTFFPQLIAGPIVHHGEMLPQFSQHKGGLRARDLNAGLTLFVLGITKKIILADSFASIADPIFNSCTNGAHPTSAIAWIGALAYTLQLYFDFSAYSDMATGIARCFGIRLPINFLSPYKSAHIGEFWRRWHITLSRFLRDYLYIPLGGNRKGASRHLTNLLLTMFLGGIWHGAGWTFVLWGALHGLLLCLHHLWRRYTRWHLPYALGVALTFFCVVLGWVLFRATDFSSAGAMLQAMAGFTTDTTASVVPIEKPLEAFTWILAGLAICLLAPSNLEIMRRTAPVVHSQQSIPSGPHRFWHWRPTLPWLLITLALVLLVWLRLGKPSPFLYYDF